MTMALVKTTYLIEGMVSGQCELKLQERLMQMKGMEIVKVVLHSSSLHIEYDPELATIDEIKSALFKIGYRIVGERAPVARYEGRDDSVS